MARVWAEIEALGLTEPERALVEACKKGEPCVLEDGKRPEGPSDKRTIRAEVLRYLILGGCEECRVHERGVQLVGAWVSGELDLSFGVAKGPTGLLDCRFEAGIEALQTHFEFLNLSGSAVPGLNAQGARVTGDVFLDGMQAEGEARLSGAQVGGQLACDGGTFRNANGDALSAQGSRVTGGVFMRNVQAEGEVSLMGAQVGRQLVCSGSTFVNAKGRALNAQGVRVTGDVFLSAGFEGEVSLSGAQIGGQLDCEGGTFRNPGGRALNAEGVRVMGAVFLRKGFEAEGEVSLLGAQIGGQLTCNGGSFRNATGRALNAQGMRVIEGFLWRNVIVPRGIVDVAGAHVGGLVDDLNSWPELGHNYLNGFTYDKIGSEFTAVNSRLKWLSRGTIWKGEFHPQPYTQLAKVYRSMGLDASARRVLMERNRLLAVYERKRLRAGHTDPSLADVAVVGNWLWDSFLRHVVGYGHAPFRSFRALFVLWFMAMWLATAAWQEGSLTPNSDVILTSPDWQAVAAMQEASALWSARHAPGQDWETFNRYAWAADLVIPILDLGQTAAWAPSTVRGGWGWHLWWARWVLMAAGWIVAALFAAAVTGILRREDD